MRLVHCSDLHFGTTLPELTSLLIATINGLKPDLVVVSGDFTQTAIRDEFEESRNFLRRLEFPWFSIPGNHDISRYNLVERFSDPYKKYRRYINENIQPVLHANGVCIAGLNTARRIVPHWNWAHGAVSGRQLSWLKEQYEAQPKAYRICVMHHPLWSVTEAKLQTIVFGGKEALQALNDMKVDLVLSGHVHHAAMQAVRSDDKNKTVFLSASTALSSRLRGQKNGFNVVDIYPDRLCVEMRGYVDKTFDKIESYEHLMAR
jgi:3',5'-cyclic AMP phosphodiesterase CpdA